MAFEDDADAAYRAEMAWEQGQADANCVQREGCPGPSVCNLGHGSDAGGHRIVEACEQCALNLHEAVPNVIIVPRRESGVFSCADYLIAV